MTHTCHWPGCGEAVPPKMWGCRRHWFTLPKRLRDLVWATYVPGQEITKTPSEAYLKVARMIQEWIAAFEFGKKKMVELVEEDRKSKEGGNHGSRSEVRTGPDGEKADAGG